MISFLSSWLHCLFNNSLRLLTYAHRQFRQTFIKDCSCLRRCLTSQHLEHSSSQRIYVCFRREHSQSSYTRLLNRRIANTHSNRTTRGLFTRNIIILRHTKVNQDHITILSQQDIARLHIQVVHIMSMDILQGRCYLSRIFQGLFFRQRAFFLYQIRQRATINVLHDIVSGTILLKHIQHLYNMRMSQLRNILRFLDKLLAKFLHQYSTSCRRNSNH